ncbi:hypothetical protein DXB37_03755 [Bacteroides uniformis]|mgnify:CR=1 FL=1|uniref:Uncharacterized protein n=5 Tax=Bacteroidaceae TaxID=815 RepID=A0A3E5F555_BACUN|nr:hypothetical protein DXB37_03755 [Bacteroides uniformis]
MKVVLFNSLTKKGILMTLKSTRDMIEKVLITDTNVINAITRQLNIKNIRNEMFPTWRLTLQPGEEYDLGTAYYGAYLVRNSDSGAAALIMVGAGVSSNILLSDGNSISTDFTAGGKIILNKKTSNGNVYVKNGRSTEAYINVMQITNY